MARIVSTRFITGMFRTRDMYNWTTFDDDEPIVSQTETPVGRTRKLTAERVRRHRQNKKLQKNLMASADIR